MNRLRSDRRERVISCLVQGMGIALASRVTGVAKNTVAKLLFDAGVACSEYLDQALRNLPCKVIQCDEIWTLRYPKTNELPTDDGIGLRDVWTWTAIDRETGLVPSWLVGRRDERDCYAFLSDLRSRVSHRSIELTTSGLEPYLSTVEPLFSSDQFDHAMLIDAFECGDDRLPSSPPTYARADPDIATGYSDRCRALNNLTMRIGTSGIARPSNTFSNKVENHAAAISLHFMYHNFARPQATAFEVAGARKQITPAMATEVATHMWSLSELAALLA
jgi:hypothetical protein